jgi:hypothetical protein
MIIPNITNKDIFQKSGINSVLPETKMQLKIRKNEGTMLLESRSVPVQDEAYFQDFWPSDICLGYS